MWPVMAGRRSLKGLELTPLEVLYEFDWPRIFSCRVDGKPFLAYQCDEDDKRLRFLLVPISDLQIHLLKSGNADVRSLLWRPHAYVVDVSYSWTPLACWRISSRDLPPDVLPKAGVMLWPQLKPVVDAEVTPPASTRRFVSVSFDAIPKFAQSL